VKGTDQGRTHEVGRGWRSRRNAAAAEAGVRIRPDRRLMAGPGLAVVIDARDTCPTALDVALVLHPVGVVIVANIGRVGAVRQEVSGDRVVHLVGSGRECPIVAA